MEMHYEIGERDNGIIDGEKVENAFFEVVYSYGYLALRVLDCLVERFILQFRRDNSSAMRKVNRRREERHRSPLSFEIVRHPANKISRSNLFMERYSGIYFCVPSSPSLSDVEQSAVNLTLFVMLL